MHRKLRFLKEQVLKAGISIPSQVIPGSVDLDELEVLKFLKTTRVVCPEFYHFS